MVEYNNSFLCLGVFQLSLSKFIFGNFYAYPPKKKKNKKVLSMRRKDIAKY